MIVKEISHYKIVEEIGKGGMGVVYKAFDTHLKRYAALKILPEKFTTDEGRKVRFFQEARAASKVSHPNIAHIYDIGEEGSISFIAMEYVEGETLRSILRQGKMLLQDALKIISQVADALSKAHENGIVHRDIKPENIMITKDGYAKILDFGLAKIAGAFATIPSEDEAETMTVAQTMEGTLLGTIAYMSPEQAMGKAVDAKSDIFSLGLVLYEMVTGGKAFAGESNIQLLNKIIETSVPPLPLEKTPLPLNLEKIIKKATEKNPDGRCTASELTTELKELIREVEAETYVPISPPGVMARVKRLVTGKNLYYTFGAFALILIVFGSYFVGTKWKIAPSVKPTVAVLYFENLSPNKEADAYFRDGITEDIITELSKIKGITVLLRDAVIPYKDQIVGVKKLKEEIGSDYVLEGSIQKAEDKLRINTRLIEASSSAALWAKSYNIDLKNVFVVQSDISKQIASALKIKITKEEEGLLAKKGTTNIEAYNNYLQGKAFSYKFTKNNIDPAIRFFEKSIELDANYSLAYSALSASYAAMYKNYFDYDEIWLDRAEEAAKKAISLDPESPEAHASLADVFRLKSRLDEALEEINQEATLRPESEDFLVEYHNNLGMIYLDKGQKDKAIEQFNVSVSFNRPSSWLAHANLANVLREKGMFEEALKEAEFAIEMHPDHEQPYREKAKILIDIKSYEESEQFLKKSIQIAPDNIHSHIEVIKLYKMQERYEEAETMMQDFIEKYPYNRGGYLALRYIYNAMGRPDDGVRVMEEAVQRNPDKYWAYNRLGVVYYKLKRFEDAIKTFEDGLLVRKDSWLHNNIGACYRELGNTEKAKASFEKAIDINPSSWAAYGNLGDLYKSEEKFDLAEKYMRKTIEIKSDVEEYYWKLGEVLQRVGRYREIVDLLEEGVRKHPDNRILINALGGVYYSLFEYENAARNFSKAIEINPQAELYCNLAQCLLNQGKFSEAESALNKSFEMRPEYETAHLNMSILHIYKNDLGKAEQLLKENAKRFTKNAGFYDWLGRLYAFQGRCQEAQEQFKKVEELEPFLVRCGTLSICYKNTLNTDKAEQLLNRSMHRATEILGKKPDVLSALSGLMQCYALRGEESDALDIAEKMGKLHPIRKNYFIASTYSLLGKQDKAIKHLKMAKEEGVRNFIEWRWDINLLPLKGNPEFKKLLE